MESPLLKRTFLEYTKEVGRKGHFWNWTAPFDGFFCDSYCEKGIWRRWQKWKNKLQHSRAFLLYPEVYSPLLPNNLISLVWLSDSLGEVFLPEENNCQKFKAAFKVQREKKKKALSVIRVKNESFQSFCFFSAQLPNWQKCWLEKMTKSSIICRTEKNQSTFTRETTQLEC